MGESREQDKEDIYKGLPSAQEGHHWSHTSRQLQPGHTVEERASYWPIDRARIAHECKKKE